MEIIRNIAVFMINSALCGASLTKTPSNEAVIAGQRMEMECRTNNDSMFRKWDFLEIGGKSPRAIATKYITDVEIPPSVSGYGVDVDQSGSVTLYSNSTKTHYAGVYICQGETIPGSKEHKYSAQLVVFESEPMCETNLTADRTASLSDGDYIWMECRVNFRGNWAPTMEWRQHPLNGNNSEGRLISAETNTIVTTNSSVTSTLIVLNDSTNNDSYFSCRTHFTWHNGRLGMNASNVPEFTHTWTTNRNLIPATTTSRLTDTINTSLGMRSQSDIEPAEPTLILMVLLLSVLSALTVAAIIRCIRRRTCDMASETRPVNIPDMANSQHETPSDPFYAEAPRSPIERETLKSNARTLRGSAATESHYPIDSATLNYFGDDGTEYMEVNAVGRQPMSVRLPVQPNIMFNVVGEYACIDHTLSPPIPPRGKNA